MAGEDVDIGAAARLSLPLPDAAATAAVAAALAPTLRPGDAALLSGGLGAGKSTFARAVIQTRLAAEGRSEDAPSPTYTLMQTYETAAAILRHADLYRLSSADEAEELGLLDDAEHAILLIEWPDRLGDAAPERRLELAFEITPRCGVDGSSAAPNAAQSVAARLNETRTARRLDVTSRGPAWERSMAAMRAVAAATADMEGGCE